MITQKLQDVIRKELELSEFDFKDETTAAEVPGWDSLNHINIVLAIEKEYNIRFKGMEILKVANLGELQKLVDSKVSG